MTTSLMSFLWTLACLSSSARVAVSTFAEQVVQELENTALSVFARKPVRAAAGSCRAAAVLLVVLEQAEPVG